MPQFESTTFRILFIHVAISISISISEEPPISSTKIKDYV